MVSSKTPVIEYLFFSTKAYTPEDGLADSVVTFDEVAEAIDAVNPSLKAAGRKTLSTRNPANFWKDLTRKNPGANWPRSVLDEGFAGADAIGMSDSACFEFVRLAEGDNTGFVASIAPSQEALENIISLETLSMPLATKALGRSDENWLSQVAARLRVIETHFALVSPFQGREITFLQTGIKLRRGEVDSAYSVQDSDGGGWLISVEVKGRGEVIHVPQVIRAASGLLDQARTRHLDVEGVLPVALKVLDRSRLHVVEFGWDTGSGSDSSVVADTVFELQPSVPGVD